MKDKELKELFKRYMKVVDSTKAHAVLSASGSERWLSCPGSVRLSEGVPRLDNPWSIRGTSTHTLIQFILENLVYWRRYLASPVAREFKAFIQYDDEMLRSAMVAVDFVQEQKHVMANTGNTPTVYIEKKVEVKGVGFGTSDTIIFQPFGVLHVIDYKNGKSLVHPEENTQGLYYAYGAADADWCGWDFQEVWITIVQPNAPHSRGPIRTWKTTPERLELAGISLRNGARKTRDKKAPLNPGEWCFFCAAKDKCPVQMGMKEKRAVEKFQRC